MRDSSKKMVVLLSILPWDFFIDYYRELAVSLSAYGTVVFVHPGEPINIYRNFRNIFLMRHLFFSFRSYWGKLVVYTPFTILPFTKYSSIRRLNEILMKLFLRLLISIKSIGRRKFLIATYPFEESVIKQFQVDKTIYDCIDYPGSGVDSGDDLLMKKRHEHLVEMADAVCVNTEAFKLLCSRAKRLVKIPAGYPLSKFQGKTRLPTPNSLHSVPRPLVGFIGYTFVRMDIKLLLSVATRNRDASFVFVGPLVGDLRYSNVSRQKIREFYHLWKRFSSLSNVYHFGVHAKEDIAAYISSFDVCIIPYDLDQRPNQYTNPIKAYEYLYFGKQIVATPMKPLMDFKEYILFANTPEEFSFKLHKALNTKLIPREISKRKSIASGNDVMKKAHAIMELLPSI